MNGQMRTANKFKSCIKLMGTFQSHLIMFYPVSITSGHKYHLTNQGMILPNMVCTQEVLQDGYSFFRQTLARDYCNLVPMFQNLHHKLRYTPFSTTSCHKNRQLKYRSSSIPNELLEKKCSMLFCDTLNE